MSGTEEKRAGVNINILLGTSMLFELELKYQTINILFDIFSLLSFKEFGHGDNTIWKKGPIQRAGRDEGSGEWQGEREGLGMVQLRPDRTI